MKPYQFLECPVCGRIVPCMQSVCDCGHRFIGIDGTAEEGSPSGGSPQAAELVYMLEDGDGFLVRVPPDRRWNTGGTGERAERAGAAETGVKKRGAGGPASLFSPFVPTKRS